MYKLVTAEKNNQRANSSKYSNAYRTHVQMQCSFF